MDYLTAQDFLTATTDLSVVDVRSPGEFKSGHLTGAVNIPLFRDEERAIVGTIYKQEGKKDAIEKGLEIVGPKMLALTKQAEKVAKDGCLGIYCWRGGMRSNRMAWLFEQTDMNCTVLESGYKAYRNTVLNSFAELHNLIVIDGPTGSGKTDLLHALKAEGEQILDLEGLANHKGSAFGNIGLPEQPTSQQFQNDLYDELRKLDEEKRIWIEREGISVGKVYLPQPLWITMRKSTPIAIEVPMEHRIRRLVHDYGQAPTEQLEISIKKLQQKLGGQNMKTALELLHLGQLEDVVLLLLKYYDKGYTYSKNKYRISQPMLVSVTSNDMAKNARTLITLADQNNL